MFGKKHNQKFRIIAVIEEFDDVAKMLREYFEEYGYKSGIVSRIEINNPSEIVILQIDPNNMPNLKKFKIEALVINMRNALIYQKEILKLAKAIEKTGAVVAEKNIIEKLEKKLPKNILTAKIDYESEEENRATHTYKHVAFYAQGLTKSLYRYADVDPDADKMWKIRNKYAYRMEALLFATVNSCGLIS